MEHENFKSAEVRKYSGDFYKEQVYKRGFRYNWIARKMGITPVMLSYYVNGKRTMPLKHHRRLQEILEII